MESTEYDDIVEAAFNDGFDAGYSEGRDQERKTLAWGIAAGIYRITSDGKVESTDAK
jgi:hypothetical protein